MKTVLSTFALSTSAGMTATGKLLALAPVVLGTFYALYRLAALLETLRLSS